MINDQYFDDDDNDGLCRDFGIEQGERRTCTKERLHKDDHYDRVNDFYWPLDDMDRDFVEFFEAMQRITQDLKKMGELQDKMHWQFGWPKEYADFHSELQKTIKGWVGSHC